MSLPCVTGSRWVRILCCRTADPVYRSRSAQKRGSSDSQGGGAFGQIMKLYVKKSE